MNRSLYRKTVSHKTVSHKTVSHKTVSWIAAVLLSLSVPVSIYAGEAPAMVDPEAAFEMLKSLDGSWTVAVPEEAEGTHGDMEQHRFRRSANDSVVMETMWAGTEHEMINMYHLDGEDLVLTHYCAGGNQPHMKLDRSASTPKQLNFAFAGGTNLDPEKDMHIHAASITFGDDGQVTSAWTGYQDGKEAGVTELVLARAE